MVRRAPSFLSVERMDRNGMAVRVAIALLVPLCHDGLRASETPLSQ